MIQSLTKLNFFWEEAIRGYEDHRTADSREIREFFYKVKEHNEYALGLKSFLHEARGSFADQDVKLKEALGVIASLKAKKRD